VADDQSRQISLDREVGQTEQPLVGHRDDEPGTVRSPAEARRPVGHFGDDLTVAVDLVAVDVGEPERTVVPARSLREHDAVDHDLGFHGSSIPTTRDNSTSAESVASTLIVVMP